MSNFRIILIGGPGGKNPNYFPAGLKQVFYLDYFSPTTSPPEARSLL
jgi:hypothetical protein